MKVILCGYNWVGCKALELLLNDGHQVFVFTHTSPSYTNSLEEYCKNKNIGYSCEKISASLMPFMPDIVASVYYRFIISDEIIELSGGRIFNLHPSLLPEYRGCSSLTWAMIEGEHTTGFTYHYLTSEVDKGNIIIQNEIKIEDFDTQISLYYRVMFEAVESFLDALKLVADGFKGTPQEKGRGSYYKRGAPNNGVLTKEWERNKIERFIRAMIFPPLPAAQMDGQAIYSLTEWDFILNK